jgi:hypothetical protein
MTTTKIPRTRRITEMRDGRETPAQRLVREYADAQTVAKAAQEKVDALKADLLAALGEEGGKAKVSLPDGHSISASIVQGSSVRIDEDRLRKAVGAVVWGKITTRVLDKRKLDAFIASGEVKPVTVAKVSEEVPTAPYPRITRR